MAELLVSCLASVGTSTEQFQFKKEFQANGKILKSLPHWGYVLTLH